MNRLELVARLHLECNMAGTSPTATLNQERETLRVITWIDDAYLTIQRMHENWKFMRKNYSEDLATGTSTLTISDLASWIKRDVRCYPQAIGDKNEQEVFYLDYNEFKRIYLFGNAKYQTGMPNQFTVRPDNTMVVWPTPDQAYTLTGEYYRTEHNMTEDAQEPLFPSRYHMVIVWYALKLFGANYAELEKYTHGINEYHRLKRELEFDQLERYHWGEPIA